jgi:nicotinate-nucleotide adenylyltransferase
MLEPVIADNPDFRLSRVEMERPGPHYMADTMRLLGEQYASADLILLIGGDSLRDLPTWQRAADLVAACHEIGVIRRPGNTFDLSALEQAVPGVQAKVHFADTPLLEISSRDIRRRIRENQPFRYFLNRSVYQYILDHGLYK